MGLLVFLNPHWSISTGPRPLNCVANPPATTRRLPRPGTSSSNGYPKPSSRWDPTTRRSSKARLAPATPTTGTGAKRATSLRRRRTAPPWASTYCNVSSSSLARRRWMPTMRGTALSARNIAKRARRSRCVRAAEHSCVRPCSFACVRAHVRAHLRAHVRAHVHTCVLMCMRASCAAAPRSPHMHYDLPTAPQSPHSTSISPQHPNLPTCTTISRHTPQSPRMHLVCGWHLGLHAADGLSHQEELG